MSVFPRFSFPEALFFLALVPWSIWVGVRIRSLSKGRKIVAVLLRSLILVCLTAALAGIEWVKKTDQLAVFFLMDYSNSVPERLRTGTVERIRELCKEFKTEEKDRSGVIVFGEEASIELSAQEKMELGEVKSFVGGEQTDLAAGVRLAAAAFPQGFMRRIVVFTDGNETNGNALEEVKIARASGTEIDVVPLMIGGEQEVRIREVSVANRVNAEEPFQVRVVVYSEQDCEATIRLYQTLREGKRMLNPQKVTLQRGDNTFLLTQELTDPGFYEYEAEVETEADTVKANNEGCAFTVIQGEPTVLYIEGNPTESTYLAPTLQNEGVKVVQRDLGGIPTTLAQFQNYDAIILSDVGATDLSSDQMRSIEAAVKDLGIGLVMIGGENSFGSGGYLDTPIEKALPVDMDLKQRKILPRGALVLLMHTCEIPNGNAWAREIGLASLNVLSSQDMMGAVGYMHQSGDSWIYMLQPVGDRSMMRSRLIQASTQIGDMPAVGPSLELAYKALLGADAAVKRIVMISDGDPQGPNPALLTALAQAKISVSTVCIAPHSGNDQGMLSNIAKTTGGQYYFVTNASNLPQIFTKEAAQVKTGMLIEKPFVPKWFHPSEILSGFSRDSLPTLHGYVATSPKDNATIALVSHEDDPVLAHWRYGLGKSVAFTSDATTRWAGDWVNWEGFGRFWTQTIRWVCRDLSPTDFRVDTKIVDGKGQVRIDAVDEEGRFVNFLRPKGVAVGPAPEFKRSEIDLLQTGPGIYEGTFPVGDQGVYMVNLTYVNQDGSEGMIPTGLAVNYSREYDYNTTNVPLLEQIAAAGGGKVLEGTENPFVHNLEASPAVTPIWQYLALIAACLFPIEVFVRRVVLNFARVNAWFASGLRRIPPLRRYIPVPEFRPGPITGRYVSSGYRGQAAEIKTVETPESFGIVVETDRYESDRKSAKKKASEEIVKGDEGTTDYTRQLLAAKKKAKEKTERRSGKDDS